MTTEIKERLEYLRGEIRAERISYGEIAELQGLAEHIDPGDVELLEWAGVPEHEEEEAVLESTYLNATRGNLIGEESLPLEDSVIDTVTDIYHFGLGQFGRCTGKVYVDAPSGAKHVGYVFQGLDKYEDSDETYLREVWISISTRRVLD